MRTPVRIPDATSTLKQDLERLLYGETSMKPIRPMRSIMKSRDR